MIPADQIARARAVDIAIAAADLGATLRRVSASERVGPCPVCGGRDRFAVNTKKQTWHCRGCAKGGSVVDLVMHVRGCDFRQGIEFLTGDGSIAPEPYARPSPPSAPRPEPKDNDNGATALALWRRRQPIVEGSPAWRYLREARRYDGLIPATLGFLPARGEHPPCMIAAIGMADEPEPGLLAISDNAVRGVHLTRLRPDGGGKAGTDVDKLTLGEGSLGTPVVLAPVNDGLGLAITEGIEDALSIAEATGLGVWAALGAGRMASLADAVPAYVECVTICGHRDPAGERGARELAARLSERGVETFLKFLDGERRAS
jgi:putative DNA primase/helicase